ncbi:hypothetical protein KEM48_005808, partial [Puccinia striiformis f. sp. tritici PST-130]
NAWEDLFKDFAHKFHRAWKRSFDQPIYAGINSDYSTAFYAIMNCFDLQGDIPPTHSGKRIQRLQALLSYCIVDFMDSYDRVVARSFLPARFRSEIMSVSYERQRKLFYLGYLLNLRQNGFKGSEQNHTSNTDSEC